MNDVKPTGGLNRWAAGVNANVTDMPAATATAAPTRNLQ